MPSKPKLEETILGHSDFKFRLEKGWVDLDPRKYPVNNCHDVRIDSDKNLHVCQWNADKAYPYKLHRI